MATQADLICKVTAVATSPANDRWFEKAAGLSVAATEFDMVAVYRGDTRLKKISFQHYLANSKTDRYFPGPWQHYQFEPGRVYLLFAKRNGDPNVYRQLWKHSNSLKDQGVILAADDQPNTDLPLKDLVWQELTGLLKGDSPEDVLYAISHLDAMSGANYIELDEFRRLPVLERMLPLITHSDDKIAQRAMGSLALASPYTSSQHAAGWLATVGDGDLPGYADWDVTKKPLGSLRYWKELVAIADNAKAPAKSRAIAIKALGGVRQPEIWPHLERWLEESDPQICEAAALLLADFPQEMNAERLKSLSNDPRPEVRASIAYAIGYGRRDDSLELLSDLLDDPDGKVTAAAAISLLSFSTKKNGTILRSRLNTDFHPLFVNALAKENVEGYVEELCDLIRNPRTQKNWWGGRTPWCRSWNLLFAYAQKQSPATLLSSDFQAVLKALESPVSDAEGRPYYVSSSEPRDLYALYLQKGLSERAVRFRKTCTEHFKYDMNYFFDQVDEHPDHYMRAFY